MVLGIKNEDIRITLNKERLGLMVLLEDEGYFMGDNYLLAFNDTSPYDVPVKDSLYALIYKASYLLSRGKFLSSKKLLRRGITGSPDDLTVYSQLVRFYEKKLVNITYNVWQNIHLSFGALISSIESQNLMSAQLELSETRNDNIPIKSDTIPISFAVYLQYAKVVEINLFGLSSLFQNKMFY